MKVQSPKISQVRKEVRPNSRDARRRPDMPARQSGREVAGGEQAIINI